jgi:arginine decarboxylase
MRALDVKEIHGYRPDLGLRVFTQAALDAQLPQPAPGAAKQAKPVAAAAT